MPAGSCSLFCHCVVGTRLLPFPANQVHAAVPPSTVSMSLSFRAQGNMARRYPPSRKFWQISWCLLAYSLLLASSVAIERALGCHRLSVARPRLIVAEICLNTRGRADAVGLQLSEGWGLYLVLRLRGGMLCR